MEIQRCYVSNAQRWFLLWASIQKGLARALWQNWAILGEQQATPRSVPPDPLHVSPQVLSSWPFRCPPRYPLQVLPSRCPPVCPQISPRCPPTQEHSSHGFHLAWSVQVSESPLSGAFLRAESPGRRPLVSLRPGREDRTGSWPRPTVWPRVDLSLMAQWQASVAR